MESTTAMVKEEPMDSGGAGPAYDPGYHALAQLSYDQKQYDVLYSKYMEHKTMEREVDRQTRLGTLLFSTVRKTLRPMIERYPTIHQRITELLEEETQVNLDSALLSASYSTSRRTRHHSAAVRWHRRSAAA